MSETQEPTVLTTEQQARTHAVMTAASVLRGQQPGRGPLTPRGEDPAKFTDIVELADYIATGDVYMINLVRREKAENPPVSMGVFGLGSELFERIFGEQPEPGSPDDDGLDEDPNEDQYKPGPRPVKDTPQAEDVPLPDFD